ncbi:hypothetical protein Leryth_000261 [Lithospermum erythrorhizon]|nr:hypothetical protein Leryth_000261 [Lithospermum erythrorhizon]
MEFRSWRGPGICASFLRYASSSSECMPGQYDTFHVSSKIASSRFKQRRSSFGCAHANRLEFRSLRSDPLVNSSRLSVRKFNNPSPKHIATVRAEYGDHRGGTGGDFVAGFLVGGAIFGALGYVLAPQVTWQNLNKKISQLNSAIDNVSSRLRGRNNMPPVPVETDPEEATM